MRLGKSRMFFRARLTKTYAAISLLASMGVMSADAATASASYTYDQVGRVTTALYDNGVCVAYVYDANGNRTSQTNSISGAPESPAWGSGVWGCFPWTPQ